MCVALCVCVCDCDCDRSCDCDLARVGVGVGVALSGRSLDCDCDCDRAGDTRLTIGVEGAGPAASLSPSLGVLRALDGVVTRPSPPGCEGGACRNPVDCGGRGDEDGADENEEGGRKEDGEVMSDTVSAAQKRWRIVLSVGKAKSRRQREN